MALIQCPECGREISSTAGKCVHCGFQFSVCPECGGITAAEDAVCRNCGYRFALPTAAPASAESSAGLKTAERHAAEDISYYKKTGGINTCLLILANCLLIVGVVLFLVWWKSYDRLEQLFYYRSFHNAIYAVLILSAILFLADRCYVLFKRGFAWIRAARKLESEKADYKGYVKSHFGSQSNLEHYERFAHAAYLAEYPKEKKFTLIDSVLSLVFEVIIVFSLDIFTCFLVGVLMDSTLLENYSFDYSCLYWLIPCGLSLIFMTVKYLFGRPHTKDYERWISLLTSGLEKSKMN